MSISSAIHSAVSGLNLNALRAEVTSHNIANSLTEEYGRREVSQSSGPSGVKVDDVIRHETPILTADRRSAGAETGFFERSLDTLERLEAVIGTPSTQAGLASKLTAFENALVAAGNAPSQPASLAAIDSAVSDVLSAFHQGTRSIQGLRQEADAAIAQDITALNSGLSQIEKLNGDIGRARAVGAPDASLIDARQAVIDQLSKIVSLKEIPRGNGTVALISSSGLVLLDGSFSPLSFEATPTIVAEMTYATDGLSGIVRSEQNIGDETGFGRLTGGTLEASFNLRDHSLTKAQDGLDRIAFDLATRLSDPLVDPSGGAADPGILTDGGAIVEATNILGFAERIELNALADPVEGGELSRWRDGIGSVSMGPIGNAEQLFRFHEALARPQADSINNTPMTLIARAADLSASLSSERFATEQDLGFSTARLEGLRSAEQAHGVDSDQELQILMQIERSYAANAKVLQAVNAMMQKILEI